MLTTRQAGNFERYLDLQKAYFCIFVRDPNEEEVLKEVRRGRGKLVFVVVNL